MSSWSLTTSGEDTIRRVSGFLGREASPDDQEALGGFAVVCATLVESHVDKILKGLFASSEGMSNGVAQVMYSELQESIFRSWSARYKWLSRAFHVTIGGEKFAQEFDLVIQVRNSIVHGNGHLTDIQSAKVQDLISLRSRLQKILGVHVSGRNLRLSGKSVQMLAKVSRDYLIGFDGTVKTEFPGFDV